jgi:hypothetical protein
MNPVTLRVTLLKADAERPGLRYHAERGNDQGQRRRISAHGLQIVSDFPLKKKL